MDEDEIDVVEEHSLDAFDTGTTIRQMTDGSLQLRLANMPPSWSDDEGAFESFEESLSAALGVEVSGLDKELFGIPNPQADTLQRLRAHLLDVRRKCGR